MATKRLRRRTSPAKASLPARKKIGKKTYTKVSCSKLKSGATSKAKAARKAGKAARVLKNPAGGYCLFTAASKRKPAAKVAAVGRRKRRRTTRRK